MPTADSLIATNLLCVGFVNGNAPRAFLFLCYNKLNGGAIGNYHAKAQKEVLWGEIMPGGLRPYRLAPINRGCVNTVVFDAVRVNDKCDETWISKTNKRLFLTAKTQPWDTNADDSDAVFKVEGAIPDPTNEPGRVVFTLSEEDTYKDPDVQYFCDIVETDSDGTSNANRLFIGTFFITPGPNNAQAGGEEE